MFAELGNFALVLALCLACIQSIFPLAGFFLNNPQWQAIARPAAFAQCLMIALAFGLLVYSFITNDFTVAYVANHSNLNLPVYYRIAATWGGHEGSLLLWALTLGGWTFAVALFSQHLPEHLIARVLGVMGVISIGILSFMLFTSNPFVRNLATFSGLEQGRDLNPLLQDLGMIFHPPLLYMGYVGFSVAFAFAIATLLDRTADAAWNAAWSRWVRPWTLLAWSFLTLGIFLGSFWAYYELGWGGWWFWDAVENASLMPWLVGTALIHTLVVSEKRDTFKNWTILLAIITFSLSLLGTFLVRSGVLTSVHAFASDPKRGIFILLFLAIITGGSLALYAWRSADIRSGSWFAWNSREAGLLLNNVFLLVAAATVLLGTLYPLFLDALGLGKISVGPAYFETIFVPLMAPVLCLMAIGPYLPWKHASVQKVLLQLRWPLVFVLLVFTLSQFILQYSWGVTFGLLLAGWIFASTLQHLFRRLFISALPANFWQRVSKQPRSYWGMLAAHSGIGIFVIGVTLVKGWEISQDISLAPGQSTRLGSYTYTFEDLKRVQGPNYIAARARFSVQQGAQQISLMYPERRIYTAQNMPMTEAAIDRSVTRDLYISLGEADTDNRWVLKIQEKPFIGWIWAGCLLIGFGGLLAATDQRYRAAQASRKKIVKPDDSLQNVQNSNIPQPALAAEVYSSCRCN